MANLGFSGIDVREANGDKLLFSEFLTDATGALVTGGTTSLYLYELQADGSLKSYDFNDNTFKSTSLTTETASMSYQTGNAGNTDTGIWTYSLATVTGFNPGSIYFQRVNNSNNYIQDKVRQFQYGGQQGGVVRCNKAQAGGASTITLDANASATNNLYRDMIVWIAGGTGAGQTASIQSYTGSSKVATIFPAWVTQPDSTSIFVLLPQSQVDIGNWLNGTIPTPNVTGVPIVDEKYILGTAITESGAGRVAGAFTTFFDVATPVLTTASVNQTGDSYAIVNSGTFGNAVLARRSDLPTGFSTLGITSGKINEVILTDTVTTYTGNTPQTGDAYAIVNSGTFGNSALKTLIDEANADLDEIIVTLGSPSSTIAGDIASVNTAVGTRVSTSHFDTIIGTPVTSVSADIAEVEADTDDIQSRLPAALVGGKMDSSVSNITAAALALFFTTDTTKVYADAVAGSGVHATATGIVAASPWDELRADHTAPGSFGEYVLGRLTTAALADFFTVNTTKVFADSVSGSVVHEVVAGQSVADNPWDMLRASHTIAGSFGEYIFSDIIRVNHDVVTGDGTQGNEWGPA
jgi:hypothetical protein